MINSEDNVIRARYITTGAYTRPEADALSEFCQHLDKAVAERLTADGHPVRAIAFSPPVQAAPGQSLEEHLREEVETLNKKEREILAYLLHHNQRMFTCDVDGGHAATLFSRGIVRRAVKAGQMFAPPFVTRWGRGIGASLALLMRLNAGCRNQNGYGRFLTRRVVPSGQNGAGPGAE